MKHLFSAVAASLGALGALAAACSPPNGAGGSGQPGSEDAGNVSPSGADGGDSDASEDAVASPPQASVRIAHASPDLPPIDVCIAPHGTTAFQGPLLGQLAESLAGGDGGAAEASLPGLSFAQVSAYLPVTAGQYDIRIVAAGAADCTVSVAQLRPFDDGEGGAEDAGSSPDATANDAGASGVPDVTNLPTLAFNTSSTLLIAGDLSPAGADPGLTVTVFTDDTTLAGGGAVLRAINAVPSAPSLDFGFATEAGAWSPVLAGVPFAGASSQAVPGYGTVDSNDYLAIAPFTGDAMSARPSGEDAAAGQAAGASVEIDFGSIATVLAVGGKTGDSASPPVLLLCMDNQPSGGLLSDCSIAR